MKIYPKSKRYKKSTRRHGYSRRQSTFKKKGHKIKVGSKPCSKLSEKEIEKELNKIEYPEIKKIKRVNIANWEDYRKHYEGPRKFKIEPLEPGFINPKRPKDIKLVNQEEKDFIDVLQHEAGHSITEEERKKKLRLTKEEYIDKLPILDKVKAHKVKKANINISEELAKKKQKEVFEK